MILKKPYGFLIKYFKIIHLFLTGLYIFLLIKVNSLLNYYNGYLEGTENRLNAIKLVTNYYLIVVILSIIICLIIYALMKYKKKPKLLYVVLIILYIITAIIINIAYSGLQQIYIYNTLDLKTLRLYQDILRILTVFQYISIGFTLIRGLGFDIKNYLQLENNFQTTFFFVIVKILIFMNTFFLFLTFALKNIIFSFSKFFFYCFI